MGGHQGLAWGSTGLGWSIGYAETNFWCCRPAHQQHARSLSQEAQLPAYNPQNPRQCTCTAAGNTSCPPSMACGGPVPASGGSCVSHTIDASECQSCSTPMTNAIVLSLPPPLCPHIARSLLASFIFSFHMGYEGAMGASVYAVSDPSFTVTSGELFRLIRVTIGTYGTPIADQL